MCILKQCHACVFLGTYQSLPYRRFKHTVTAIIMMCDAAPHAEIGHKQTTGVDAEIGSRTNTTLSKRSRKWENIKDTKKKGMKDGQNDGNSVLLLGTNDLSKLGMHSLSGALEREIFISGMR